MAGRNYKHIYIQNQIANIIRYWAEKELSSDKLCESESEVPQAIFSPSSSSLPSQGRLF
jgi:hypothetical protein